MNILLEAFAIAEAAHRGQTRKDGVTPFITHPLSVAEIVVSHAWDKERHWDDEILAACILHDVVEDSSYPIEMIETSTTNRVRKLVVELTNEFTSQKYPNLSRRERKAKELERISKISDDAKAIKMADRIHNLRSRGMEVGHIRKNYIPESEALLEICKHADEGLATELTKAIEDAKAYLKMATA